MICKCFLTFCRLSFCFLVFLDAQKFSVLMKFKFSTFVTVLLVLYFDTLGFPGGSVVKNSPVNAGDAGDVRSLAWEDSLEKSMATHSSILAWKIP